MKIDQFQQLVLYCLSAILAKTYPHISSYIVRCISNNEITGNVKENIYAEKEFIESFKKGE